LFFNPRKDNWVDLLGNLWGRVSGGKEVGSLPLIGPGAWTSQKRVSTTEKLGKRSQSTLGCSSCTNGLPVKSERDPRTWVEGGPLELLPRGGKANVKTHRKWPIHTWEVRGKIRWDSRITGKTVKKKKPVLQGDTLSRRHERRLNPIKPTLC